MLFSFAAKDLLPLVEHALKSTDHSMPYGVNDPEPGLLLVHDEGVYLMSNGKPHQSAGDPDNPKRAKVVYARGWGPQSHLGGDDFVDFIPTGTLGAISKLQFVEIELTADELLVRKF